MANIFNSRKLKLLCISILAVSTTLDAVHYPNSMVIENQYGREDTRIDKNVLFFKRIGDLVSKVKKCSKSQNAKKIKNLLFQLKDEVEGFTGQQIHIKKLLRPCY